MYCNGATNVQKFADIDHPVVSGNVHLPDLVHGTSWQQYLHGLETNEWRIMYLSLA